MRQGQNNGFLHNADGRLIALNLGADYCAEHEWGIKPIREAFGIDDKKLGLQKRMQNARADTLVWYIGKTNDKAPKQFEGIWYKASDWAKDPHGVYFSSRGGTLWTGWSESDFAAFSTDAAEVAKLKEIYDALHYGNAAVWLGGGGVFQNAGLVIAIAERLSKETTDAWQKADVDRRDLLAEVAATGIEKRLKAAGKGYYALSPKRKPDGSIHFWLNPFDQKENNSTWCSIKDLEEWIEGKGPIPKKGKR